MFYFWLFITSAYGCCQECDRFSQKEIKFLIMHLFMKIDFIVSYNYKIPY